MTKGGGSLKSGNAPCGVPAVFLGKRCWRKPFPGSDLTGNCNIFRKKLPGWRAALASEIPKPGFSYLPRNLAFGNLPDLLQIEGFADLVIVSVSQNEPSTQSSADRAAVT
ncbi:hypothetical protein HK15_09085 [Acetobacter orientalis]|uniref:Uncharacterized protein n=1 Tax=Acetobacter orientalis TaxID=146474 RepID=A0A252BA01_9PROT|nr:hypothetical protein HK15_09085 [Acetobacter orientalis]